MDELGHWIPVCEFQAFYSEDECGEFAPDTEKLALAMGKKIVASES